MVVDVFKIHRFITSAAFSIIVETAVIFLLLRYVFKHSARELPLARILIAGIFATFATIPYVWFVFPNLTETWSSAEAVWYSELFIFLVEAVFYKIFLNIKWTTALAISLLANTASYFLGPFLRTHNWWIYW